MPLRAPGPCSHHFLSLGAFLPLHHHHHQTTSSQAPSRSFPSGSAPSPRSTPRRPNRHGSSPPPRPEPTRGAASFAPEPSDARCPPCPRYHRRFFFVSPSLGRFSAGTTQGSPPPPPPPLSLHGRGPPAACQDSPPSITHGMLPFSFFERFDELNFPSLSRSGVRVFLLLLILWCSG
uniref:Uncharacterized protein n=1 Tax=Setaria viridis TaxID=4556 RepID=A0A4U6W2N7_SETVI|nr:hypothetical protein SEVIR_2G451150v2 [Setaria viridis]